MNSSLSFRIVGVFTCVLLFAIAPCATAGPATAPTTQTAIEPLAQLEPGKAAGTFHLVYHGRAQFSMPGHCALIVRILAMYQANVTAGHFADATEFTAEADLRPGTYTLSVEPADGKDADYWPSDYQRIHIDKSGHLYQPRPWFERTAGIFVLDRRIKGISPDGNAVADARQPLLKWPAVPGATHYQGDYRGGARMKWFDVEETQFLIGGGVQPGNWCAWRISAIDANGKTLARGEGSFAGHGTDQATLAQMGAGGGACGLPPPPGMSYLGVRPLSALVPKDPRTPQEFGGAGKWIQGSDPRFVPGIEIDEVLCGSPAVDADLHPDDVVIAIDGQPVPSEDASGDPRGFSEQLRAMEPERRISLTVRRFPRELTLHAIIGRYPGGGAATQPAIPGALAAPTTAPASRSVWNAVESGSPARYPFHVDAGADIPVLSTNEGLVGDFVQCMAELPHGGMAFGSYEGLSVWDGREIRDYSGPAFSAQTFSAVEGNSPLPSNHIQDLLCDSHGRLWVATGYGVCRVDDAPNGAWHVLENPRRTALARQGMDQCVDVQKMFETSDGTIVLGARGAAITLINPKTDTPSVIYSDGEMNHWISGIAEDSQHRLWFAAYGVGVLRYDGAKVEQIHGPWIAGDDLRGMCIDRAGTIWIAQGKSGLGALYADGTTETVAAEQLAGGYVHSVSIDRSGRVWATCEGGIAMRAADDSRGKSRAWQFAGTGDHWTWYALCARDGSWWVSSSKISRIGKLEFTAIKPRNAALEHFKRETEKTYPNVKVDRQTAVSPGGLVALVADNLVRFDGRKWEDLGQRLGHPSIRKIQADSKGIIWLATSNGLIGVEPSGEILRYNNDAGPARSTVNDLDQAPDGTLYVATEDGLYRLKDKTWGKVGSDQPMRSMNHLVVDRRGWVWMMEFTFSGLYLYDGRHFREIKDQTILSDEELRGSSLRLDAARNVLLDLPAQPARGLGKRTFRWEGSTDEKLGQPVEMK